MEEKALEVRFRHTRVLHSYVYQRLNQTMDGLIRDVRESMAIRLDETHQHPALFKLAAIIAFLLTLVGVWQAINSDGAKNISKR